MDTPGLKGKNVPHTIYFSPPFSPETEPKTLLKQKSIHIS